MSLFANVPARVFAKAGHNRKGEPIYDETGRDVLVGVVHLIRSIAPTSVRTDSSASRGAAEERQAQATLLFPLSDRPVNGERVAIMDTLLRVENVELRYDVFGTLEHYQASLVLWDDRVDA